MISKYPGTCVHCGKPTRAGKDHYDDKASYHAECRDQATAAPSEELCALADRLGYAPAGTIDTDAWFGLFAD